MDRYTVAYQGGQSRTGTGAVDYMLAVIDGAELYAERASDESDENANYDDLRADILEQAEEQGIEAVCLTF